jgi:hypothetical protein
MQAAYSAFLGHFLATPGLARIKAYGVILLEFNVGSQRGLGCQCCIRSLVVSGLSCRRQVIHSETKCGVVLLGIILCGGATYLAHNHLESVIGSMNTEGDSRRPSGLSIACDRRRPWIAQATALLLELVEDFLHFYRWWRLGSHAVPACFLQRRLHYPEEPRL